MGLLNQVAKFRRLWNEAKNEAPPAQPVQEGDGKAVILTDMTEVEYEDYVHEVEQGWGPFYDKLKTNLGFKTGDKHER